MRKTNKIPDTFHRVILSDGKWLRSPVVSNKGVVTEGQSDMFGLGRTEVLAEASAWSLDRARYIASQFPNAHVDRVAAELGTTDHKVPAHQTVLAGMQRLSDWLAGWKNWDGVVLHEKDGLFSGLSITVFTKHKPRRFTDAAVEFLFWMERETHQPTLMEVAIPNISTNEVDAILEFQTKVAQVHTIVSSFHKTFPET